MKDEFAREIATLGQDERLKVLVDEVCRLTGMGFAAMACVTADRWITCQVADHIGFGLDPGDELEVQTTICDDIRQSGQAIIIDEVSASDFWRTHHTPVLYGFESYVSFPIILSDGTFFGTLCAIDSEPRRLSAPETVEQLRSLAQKAVDIISEAQHLPSRLLTRR